MIIWGKGGGESIVGQMKEEKQCPVCDKVSQHSVEVRYRYAHIWYLFSWLTSREYLAVCGNCNNGVVLDKAQAQREFPKDNIPFVRKKGWMIGLVLLFFVLVAGALANQQQNEQTRSILSSPLPNDVYSADLAQIEGSGYSPDSSTGIGEKSAFGFIKLMSIDGDELYFAVSSTAYSKKKSLRQSLPVEFVTDDFIVLSKDDVMRLNKKQIIFDARRGN